MARTLLDFGKSGHPRVSLGVSDVPPDEERPRRPGHVVDGCGAGDAALTARAGLLQAQQADDVRPVGVQVLALRGLVEPDARVDSGDAAVADVTQQVTGCVLADRGAKLEAESNVGQLDLSGGELLDGIASDEDEAPPSASA